MVLTPYPDINEILGLLTENLKKILGDQLMGLYLTGSLTYGDFDRGSSDIDFLAILKRPLSKEQLEQVKKMHAHIGESYPLWAERIEGSYITEDMLSNIEPPKTPRPYINQGKMWDPDPPYGNEWLLNLYALYECGVALIGPEPKKIIAPIDFALVREASRKDLIEEWQPKLQDPSFFNISHHQAYLILTLCRILYRAMHEGVASKRVSSTWVKNKYGKPWSALIEKAEKWEHGLEMNAVDETLNFLKFTLQEIENKDGHD